MAGENEKIQNRLLRALPGEVLQRLEPLLQPVTISPGQVITRVNGPVRYLYFVNRGFISTIKTMRNGRSIEIGGAGREGVTSPSAALGTRGSAPMDSLVQVPGTALRIECSALKQEARQEPILARMIEECADFELQHIAQSAACNRLHSVEERCCRSLLVAHDNVLSDTFSLTHAFLAMMLGGPRPVVSIAAKALQRAGLIAYSRGNISIRDRKGLEDRACECYASMHEEIGSLYGAEPTVLRSSTTSVQSRHLSLPTNIAASKGT
jgi:CRP-like cAMP-binding protein